MNLIIAGIHTGVGKTVCSAVICQALGYDYWKPVQAGELNNSDSIFIKNNVSNAKCFIHPERYRLNVPASPHYAAAEDGMEIKPTDFVLPKTSNYLLVETAGGVMSPLAKDFLIIDLMKQLDLPAIVVSNNYLGSINHTLLTVAALRQREIPILGIVYSGEAVQSTREFIIEHTKVPVLFSIPQFTSISKEVIADFAKTFSIHLNH
jgi:dethiobiotin synthetase